MALRQLLRSKVSKDPWDHPRKDTFSDARNTDRQREYSSAFNDSTIFTLRLEHDWITEQSGVAVLVQGGSSQILAAEALCFADIR